MDDLFVSGAESEIGSDDVPVASEQFVICERGRLRCGFTTGSCAAMASLACVRALLSGRFPDYVELVTPKGWKACAEVECASFLQPRQAEDESQSTESGQPIKSEAEASQSALQAKSEEAGSLRAVCAVRKDAGDDADVTDGLLIFAQVELEKTEDCGVQVEIKGGKGVGIVTLSGLEQKVGEAAINSVPRKMICEAVRRECERRGFKGKARVTIEVPEGERAAERTFNGRLGIKGGISILGTSGVVEPMSESALLSSIEAEIKMLAVLCRDGQNKDGSGAEGKSENTRRALILTPGNYGISFVRSFDSLKGVRAVKCSNFIGRAIDFACAYDFNELIIAGHAGKLVKVAGGIMNTHSAVADCRVEIIGFHAALSGASQNVIAKISECATADAAFDTLEEARLLQSVINSLYKAARRCIRHRIRNNADFKFLMFTNKRGLLKET